MTNQEKLASKQKAFLFFRVGGFYPVTLPEATLHDNITGNSGTLKVESGGKTIWTQADGYLDRRFADMAGAAQ